MARNIKANCKLCRRAGDKLFLKGERCDSSKCAMVKKNYPPGLHGPKGRGRISGYGERLREKQKAKQIYGVFEKQFRNYFEKAQRKKGNSAENMLRFLELRLDNVVFRANFASSRKKARQIVNHGHIKVNGKKASIASYQVKVNDEISVNEKSLNNKIFQELKKTLGKKEAVKWITVDKDKLSFKINALPDTKDLESQIAINLIIEYYSR
ncbi:30S ribosomal protein S4 [Patescibacteria group bacterium]|nr:30S ribosomal protein S4 [Patescibacteria group bacterium]